MDVSCKIDIFVAINIDVSMREESNQWFLVKSISDVRFSTCFQSMNVVEFVTRNLVVYLYMLGLLFVELQLVNVYAIPRPAYLVVNYNSTRNTAINRTQTKTHKQASFLQRTQEQVNGHSFHSARVNAIYHFSFH